MELENSFVVPADLATAWETLLDVEAITPCMPGATLTSFTGDEFAADVKVKLGPVLMTFGGAGRFLSKDPSTHTAVIEASGKEKKGAGMASARITARLIAEGPTTTRADIVTDLTVTGKAAQFGRGVMVDVSKNLIGQFARNLSEVIAARTVTSGSQASLQDAAETPSGPPTAAPVTTPVLDNAPMDLGNAALVPVLKRLIPAVVIVVAAGALLWWFLASR